MYGMLSPWMNRMGGGQGGAGQMTPGSGMPPAQNAPFDVSRMPQMGPPQVLPPPAGPTQGPQGQTINPAQMGLLSMLMKSLGGAGGDATGSSALGSLYYGSPANAMPSMLYGGPR